MDGFTESVIVVLGNPIAGNPTQFAIEKGLASLSLDWRVLSLEVSPDDLGVAVEGFRVTGIRAVWLDSSLASEDVDGYVRRDDRWEPFQIREEVASRIAAADPDCVSEQLGSAGQFAQQIHACLEFWTGRDVALDVLTEAIEEYQSV